MVDAFHGNTELADSVNHLLVVGFYLINIGYVTLALRATETLNTLRSAIELVSDKVGLVLLVLGFMHFFNLFVFSRIRKRARAGSKLRPSRFRARIPQAYDHEQDLRSRPAKKSDETRARMLEAALTLFRNRGFENTTMRDIAKASRGRLGGRLLLL